MEAVKGEAAPVGSSSRGEGERSGPFLSQTHQAHLQNCPSCCLPVSKENDRLINRPDLPLSHKGGRPTFDLYDFTSDPAFLSPSSSWRNFEMHPLLSLSFSPSPSPPLLFSALRFVGGGQRREENRRAALDFRKVISKIFLQHNKHSAPILYIPTIYMLVGIRENRWHSYCSVSFAGTLCASVPANYRNVHEYIKIFSHNACIFQWEKTISWMKGSGPHWSACSHSGACSHGLDRKVCLGDRGIDFLWEEQSFVFPTHSSCFGGV